VNLDGSVVLPAPPEAVWAMVTDPAVLARTIPGCVSLEQAGEDSYRMTVAAGVGAIRGTYAGEVRLADLEPHTSYVMHASGAGAPGSVRATVTINLTPDGDGTVLTYSADAVVGGAVAGVGQRMITGVARRTAGQFFAALEAELASSRAPVPAGTAAGGAAEPPVEAPQPSATSTGHAVPAGGWIPAESRPLLVGAAGGGVLTLLGVWVGYLIGRRR
jgi:uncharacterized protein